VSDRFHARIPCLAFDQVLVHLTIQQRVRFGNLIRETCRGQNLSQQRVGVKRNGR
jgi:hypothetical protein